LLVSFLEHRRMHSGLAPLVSAARPFIGTRVPERLLPASADQLDAQIASIEPDSKSMPVLLRQYLRLNARLLGVSLDDQFGNVLDALMMVDLAAVEPGLLARYLGREGTLQYLSRHNPSVVAASAAA